MFKGGKGVVVFVFHITHKLFNDVHIKNARPCPTTV